MKIIKNYLKKFKIKLVIFESIYCSSILCGLAYVLYICRQTIWAESYDFTIIFIAITLLSLAIALNLNFIYIEIIKIIRQFLLCALSILMSCVLFHDLSSSLGIISKCFLLFFTALIAIKSNGRALIIMADFGALFLFAIGLFVLGGLIEFDLITNEVWVKNNLGFKNPNIGPYFALSSLFIYFISGKKVRFICFTILVCLAYIYFSAFSRTYYVGILLLAFYMLVHYNKIWLHYFILVMTLFIFSVIIIYLTLILLIATKLIAIQGWIGFIDHMLSARLTKVYEINFFISEVGGIFKIDPLDNIFYELIFIFGPYIIYVFLQNFKNILLFYNLDKRQIVFSYSILVFIFLGMFDGIFVKFSPMVVAVLVLIFIKNYHNRNKFFL